MHTKSINNRRRGYYYRPEIAEHLLESIDIVNAYIDSAYDDVLKRFSYAIVLTDSNDVVIDKLYGSSDHEDYLSSKSIAGEVFGALYAIKYAIQKGYKKIIIHYSFDGLEQWATRDWNTNKPISQDYVHSFFKYSSDIYIAMVKGKSNFNLEASEIANSLLIKELVDSNRIK